MSKSMIYGKEMSQQGGIFQLNTSVVRKERENFISRGRGVLGCNLFTKNILGLNNHKLHHSTFYGPHNNSVFSPMLFSITSFICMLRSHSYIIKNEISTRYYFKTSSDVFGHMKCESNHCSIF